MITIKDREAGQTADIQQFQWLDTSPDAVWNASHKNDVLWSSQVAASI